MKREGEDDTNEGSKKNENESQGGKADRTIHIMSSESFKPDLIINENCEGSKSFLKVMLINEWADCNLTDRHALIWGSLHLCSPVYYHKKAQRKQRHLGHLYKSTATHLLALLQHSVSIFKLINITSHLKFLCWLSNNIPWLVSDTDINEIFIIPLFSCNRKCVHLNLLRNHFWNCTCFVPDLLCRETGYYRMFTYL